MIYGCGNHEKASIKSLPVEESIVTAPNEPQKIDVERKLIKKGFVEFMTEDINATRQKIIESEMQCLHFLRLCYNLYRSPRIAMSNCEI